MLGVRRLLMRPPTGAGVGYACATVPSHLTILCENITSGDTAADYSYGLSVLNGRKGRSSAHSITLGLRVWVRLS